MNNEQEINLEHLTGAFDIIGDVHGCYDELVLLLEKLGYTVKVLKAPKVADWQFDVMLPEGRLLAFVGDLVDRGPKIPQVLRLVMQLVQEGKALCVPGNHDDKLYRKLLGRNVQVKNGLEDSMEQLEKEPKWFLEQVRDFIGKLPHHIILDEGKLLVAHAGLEEKLHARSSKSVRALCLFGPTTGETDEHGLPVRINWAADYKGKPLVVYGHTPVAEPVWQNNAVNIDTGCVYGGKLTALRYPEKETVAVESLRQYAEAKRPFLKK